VKVWRRRPTARRPRQRSLARDDCTDALPAGHRVVERRIAIPGGRGQLFVAATELDENVVLAVGDHESLPREDKQGCRVGVLFEGDPPIGGNGAKSAHLLVAERELLAVQDRQSNERAVVLRA
jgi:hypothetical protein